MTDMQWRLATFTTLMLWALCFARTAWLVIPIFLKQVRRSPRRDRHVAIAFVACVILAAAFAFSLQQIGTQP